ncbi:MAG TPA: amidohydrolase [Clostridia bacterium]|nr:amidohydrolase [Clostridia bacterium]
MSKILIKNCVVVPVDPELPEDGALSYPGEIAVDGSEIVYVGPPGTTPGDFAPDRVIDAAGKVALPGFINAHTHAAMTLFRGFADDLPLMEWLNNRIWPLEAKLTAEDIYWGTKLAILEMLKGGITAFADMYFSMDRVAEAVWESGMRASLARGLVGGERGGQSMAEAEELLVQWQNRGAGRITFMLGPHAPYTCSPDFLRLVVDKAKEHHLGLHIHLAETMAEVEDIKKRYGKRPVELVHDIGLFEVPVLAAHCVHLTEHEIEILKENHVSVAHNPESNMKLASGIARVPEMLNRGVNVALGTDGAASNNNLDLFGEMRTAALLHKVDKLDPTVVNAYQVLQMATVNGAKALGLDRVGSLKPGYKADLILVDFEKPHLYPHHDVVAHLVYAAQPGDVDLVMVDGRVLVEKGRVLTMDEEEIYQRVKECVQRIVG